MAFEEKDTTTPVNVSRASSVEEIIFRRNRELPAPSLEVIVVRKIAVGTEVQVQSKRVPPAVLANAWPGQQRTLAQHLGLIIDNATD